jgi:hypothetical protein
MLCKCDLICSAVRSDLKHRKGHVTEARQASLLWAVIAAHS